MSGGGTGPEKPGNPCLKKQTVLNPAERLL